MPAAARWPVDVPTVAPECRPETAAMNRTGLGKKLDRHSGATAGTSAGSRAAAGIAVEAGLRAGDACRRRLRVVAGLLPARIRTADFRLYQDVV